MLKTAIVILNWNGVDFLKKFLPTVIQYSESEETKVIVADNGSTDESIRLLQTDFPETRIIELDRNYGFSEGYNRALEQIEAEYFVLLNSDVEVTPNWVDPIINAFEKDASIGAAMPKMKAYHDKKLFEYAGAAGGFIDKMGYPFCRGRIISEVETDEGQYNDAKEIFWASGACMFVRSKVYRECGGLDNDFFAHMEEIDLCWRIKTEGYKIMYFPDVEVYHVGGGTLPNNSPGKIYLNYRNNLSLLYKNLPSGKLWTTILFRMMLDFVSALLYIAQGKFSFYTSVVKAHWHFVFQLKKMRKKRKALLRKRSNKLSKEVFDGCIVFDFFLKGKKRFDNYGL